MRAYEKNVKKAVSKKNKDLADRLLTRKPTYTLDMLIRERYPKFIDSLRDLDDCLTMVHLFVALPAIERENIQAERIHNCRGLYHSINLKYPPILDPRLKALAADLYALTRYVDAKDQTKGANVEVSELRLAQLQTKGHAEALQSCREEEGR
ncbi:hypothetical protein L6452_18638 [Arctium lappa]|uniref:Uncharacterized protein n=1 Tax=Arctium lappa TaxID=4217 RepID=A0ACB9C6Y9_ARCLA|nr:hypothetical protein L6452_18638 [Arctium lappa]